MYPNTTKLLLLWCSLCFSVSTYSQELSVTDSLRHALARAETDSTKATLMMLIANRLPMSDSIKIREYYRKALELTNPEQPILVAKIYGNLGRFYYNMYHFEEARQYLDTARNTIMPDTSVQGKKLSGLIRMNAAALYGVHGDIRKQQEEYLQLIPLFTKLKDTTNLSVTYRNLGVIFFNKAQYDKALEYYTKALKTHENSDKTNYYSGAGHLDIALCLNEMDSLKPLETYLRKAEDIIFSSKDTVDQMAQLYYLKGELAYKKKNYTESGVMYRKALKLARKFKNLHYMANALFGLVQVGEAKKEYTQALAYAEEYYRIGSDLKDFHFQLLALEKLAEIEYQLKHYPQSYNHFRKYIGVADSLNEVELTKTLHDLDVQYESANKEKQIANLQYEMEAAELRLVRNQMGIWLLLITVAGLLSISILYYKYYKKGKTLITQQKRVHQLEMDTLQQKHKISLLYATINGEEHERSRIAQDLHDGLGGLLSGIKLSLSNTVKDIQNDRANENVSRSVKHMDEAVDELRNIAQSLMPQVLNIQGLGEAVKQFCNKVSRSGPTITCQVIHVSESIPKNKQVTVYRIVQELVNNALKHASATQILVQLQQRKGKLFLTVEDNGIGFDPGADTHTNGLGMSSLKARVELLEGEMDIHSGAETGTSVNIQCMVG
ncbi:tetratricopeptide repeat-containing sensor histidine kinase [Sinomicrobium oceani]|uniref:tetratricopeptide repeat-containing sensor histidine kinase n=1 Tax=Sinomicrobium oceani TaxID=1150368 RepID=UPI00227C2F31|nr:ATP-binding protein [Sinomicrobium oceani]